MVAYKGSCIPRPENTRLEKECFQKKHFAKTLLSGPKNQISYADGPCCKFHRIDASIVLMYSRLSNKHVGWKVETNIENDKHVVSNKRVVGIFSWNISEILTYQKKLFTLCTKKRAPLKSQSISTNHCICDYTKRF